MHHHCEGDGPDRSIEVTEANEPQMVHECTAVALQASAAHTNGWYKAARGYLMDMGEVWGGYATVRMSYVWGAGRFFLPAPPGQLAMPGHTELAGLCRERDGEEPDPARLARMVADGDQLTAAVQAVALAASKGDLDAVSDVLEEWGDTQGQGRFNDLMLALMADCGQRLRHSRDIGDTRAYELFQAHIAADLPCTHDHDPEGETGDAHS